jgi:hypothetical protein
MWPTALTLCSYSQSGTGTLTYGPGFVVGCGPQGSADDIVRKWLAAAPASAVGAAPGNTAESRWLAGAEYGSGSVGTALPHTPHPP